MIQKTIGFVKRVKMARALGWRESILFVSIMLPLTLSGCGKLFEDNGTHLGYALEKGAKELQNSNANELSVRYETLDGEGDPYYVEITPSEMSGQAPGVWGSYLVVSGKSGGGTSYHNRFVFVPQRLYIEKKSGGAVDVILRKDGDHVSVVEIR